jgi:2-keto-4-pentenoate hydratase/2-oxohepta-3-ene-1,7-dioic acid hydratase in catechol pathway
MRLVSFEHSGERGWGIITPRDEIVCGNRRWEGRYPTLKAALAALDHGAIADMAESETPDLALDAVWLLPPVPDPEHIYCAGLNYLAHAHEVAKAAPDAPRIFLRTASSLVAHGQPIERPKVSTDLDYEGELAVVIGQGGRNIAAGNAMEHVAGYTCFMDGSIRDYQKNTTTAGKNFHATGAMGPWLVTPEEIGDWRELSLETRLNGEVVQSAKTSAMMVSIGELIAYVSTISVLQPGDVIVTGTPEGIGCRREPPLWMKPGDVIEVDISRIGTLRNRVVDET